MNHKNRVCRELWGIFSSPCQDISPSQLLINHLRLFITDCWSLGSSVRGLQGFSSIAWEIDSGGTCTLVNQVSKFCNTKSSALSHPVEGTKVQRLRGKSVIIVIMYLKDIYCLFKQEIGPPSPTLYIHTPTFVDPWGRLTPLRNIGHADNRDT